MSDLTSNTSGGSEGAASCAGVSPKNGPIAVDMASSQCSSRSLHGIAATSSWTGSLLSRSRLLCTRAARASRPVRLKVFRSKKALPVFPSINTAVSDLPAEYWKEAFVLWTWRPVAIASSSILLIASWAASVGVVTLLSSLWGTAMTLRPSELPGGMLVDGSPACTHSRGGSHVEAGERRVANHRRKGNDGIDESDEKRLYAPDAPLEIATHLAIQVRTGRDHLLLCVRNSISVVGTQEYLTGRGEVALHPQSRPHRRFRGRTLPPLLGQKAEKFPTA